LHVEIVEPTLVTEAGHCAALFDSLRAAAPGLPYRLWIDRHADVPRIERRGVVVQRHFSRRWRKLQAPWLYRRLLGGDSPIVVPTATWFDLRALDLASHGPIGALRAFLYFHKWRPSPQRAAALRRLARRQPLLRLYGTSEAIVQQLRQAGFEHVEQIVPVLGEAPAPAAPVPFAALLSAGAARADKGFAHIVDLVELLQAGGSDLPIVVQVSGDHYGRHDERTRADLLRLRRATYPHLTVLAETLDARRYHALFAGSICLQPYGRHDYADKMSAVTFDALRSAAPIVTAAGTTMARTVADSGAGLVVEQPTAAALLKACLAVRERYAMYSERALRAGAAHGAAAAWRPLVAQLEQACGASAGLHCPAERQEQTDAQP
jgi:hypothetical protein